MNKRYIPLRKLAMLGILILCIFAAGVWATSTTARRDNLPGPKNILAGSGNVVRESREVSNMDGAVQLEAPGELVITPGEANELIIEAEDTFLGVIQTRVENGTLIVALTIGPNDTLQINHPIRYLLTVAEIHSLKLSGTGSIEALDIQTDDLEVQLNGGGKMTLAGQADRQNVDINGGGIYQAGDLKTSRITLNSDGAVDATVWATEYLEAACKGGCSVKYYGNPELGTAMGVVGTVTKLGDR